MRVCLDLTPLSTKSRFRGIGTFVLGLKRALQDLHDDLHDLELCLLVGRGLGMHVVALDDPQAESKCTSGEPINYFTYYRYKELVLAQQLRRAGVDLCHCVEPKGTPHLRDIKMVLTCHDLIPTIFGPPYLPRLWPRRLNALIETWRYRGRAHVICISDWTRRDVCRITGVDWDATSTVHHGVDRDFYHPEPQDDDRRQVAEAIGARPYFLYVGGFDARKQVVALIEGFGRCAADLPQVLAICGRPEPAQQRQIEAAAARAGVTDRVLFLGFVPDEQLVALLRHATAHTMMSTYEGFGLTVIEAFACGCPVVATTASCVPEVAGGAALLIDPPLSPDGIANALRRIATDEALRGELRRKGLQRAKELSWHQCAKQTVEIYRRVLSSPSKRW